MRVLSNHCRRPRYIKALAKGGKRFDLNNRFKGEITAEEQEIAQKHPAMQTVKTEQTAEPAQPAESAEQTATEAASE